MIALLTTGCARRTTRRNQLDTAPTAAAASPADLQPASATETSTQPELTDDVSQDLDELDAVLDELDQILGGTNTDVNVP